MNPERFNPLVKVACSNSPLAEQAQEILAGEHLVTPEGLDGKISDRLLVWSNTYTHQDRQDKADIVETMRIGYGAGDIPF
jgi:hypothetical protein